MTTSDDADSTAELDLYQCLGVAKTADALTLKKAYRALALSLHPDKTHGDKAAAARFKDVTRAYNCLADPSKRQYYDSTGSLDGVDVSAEEWMTFFAETMQMLTGGQPIQVSCQLALISNSVVYRRCQMNTVRLLIRASRGLCLRRHMHFEDSCKLICTQDMLRGLSMRDLAAMPPFPFPRELFPAGTFPPACASAVRACKACHRPSKLC